MSDLNMIEFKYKYNVIKIEIIAILTSSLYKYDQSGLNRKKSSPISAPSRVIARKKMQAESGFPY